MRANIHITQNITFRNMLTILKSGKVFKKQRII